MSASSPEEPAELAGSEVEETTSPAVNQNTNPSGQLQKKQIQPVQKKPNSKVSFFLVFYN